MGAQATKENITEIRAELEGTTLFSLLPVRRRNSTGAIPVVGELTRELGCLTIACVTIPFKIEQFRREKAREAIKRSPQAVTQQLSLITKLREVAGNLPLKEALAVANALIGAFVKNITETITQPSLINLDYADLRAVMERGGVSAIGIAKATRDRVAKAVSQALAVPLLDISICQQPMCIDPHSWRRRPDTRKVAVTGELIMTKSRIQESYLAQKSDDQLTGRVRVMAVLTCQEPIHGSDSKI